MHMNSSQMPLLPGPPTPTPTSPSAVERVYDDTYFQYDTYTVTTLPFAQGSPVEIINRRRQGGKWEPFLMVAPSAVLLGNGHNGLGLYSLINYPTNSVARIGRYTGCVLERFAESEGTAAHLNMGRYAQEGRRHLLLMIVNDGEDVALVDGIGGSLPKIFMANDARGMRSPDNSHNPMRNNTRFGRDGRGHLYKMGGRAIPAANLAATTLKELWRSELLVSYSSFFWNLQNRVGREELPIDLTRTVQEADSSEQSEAEEDLAVVDVTSRFGMSSLR